MHAFYKSSEKLIALKNSMRRNTGNLKNEEFEVFENVLYTFFEKKIFSRESHYSLTRFCQKTF